MFLFRRSENIFSFWIYGDWIVLIILSLIPPVLFCFCFYLTCSVMCSVGFYSVPILLELRGLVNFRVRSSQLPSTIKAEWLTAGNILNVWKPNESWELQIQRNQVKFSYFVQKEYWLWFYHHLSCLELFKKTKLYIGLQITFAQKLDHLVVVDTLCNYNHRVDLQYPFWPMIKAVSTGIGHCLNTLCVLLFVTKKKSLSYTSCNVFLV